MVPNKNEQIHKTAESTEAFPTDQDIDSLFEFNAKSDLSLFFNPDPDIRDLAPQFLNNRIKELSTFELAVEANEFDAIKKLAHTWKGISRPYGFIYLETLSKKIESAAQRMPPDKVQIVKILKVLHSYFNRVNAFINA